MSFLGKILDREARNKLWNYLRPYAYFLHPELKVNHIPKSRKQMLLTMRDLRLWVIENVSHSSRSDKYQGELYQITRELAYLQYKAFFIGNFMLFAAVIYFCYWGPKHWRGHTGMHGRPV